jgi:hypothetical protein
MVSMSWARSPISLKHVTLWCLTLDPPLTTYYSNIGVRAKRCVGLGTPTLVDEHAAQGWGICWNWNHLIVTTATQCFFNGYPKCISHKHKNFHRLCSRGAHSPRAWHLLKLSMQCFFMGYPNCMHYEDKHVFFAWTVLRASFWRARKVVKFESNYCGYCRPH